MGNPISRRNLIGLLAGSAAGLHPALKAAADQFSLSFAPATESPVRLLYPNGLALDKRADLYISDIGTHALYKLDRQGRLTIVAGTGSGGFNGDDRPASGAQLFAPHDLTCAPDGSLLIADTANHRIRRIDQQGIITTIAGGGIDSGGPLNNPQSIALDYDGSLLIADTYNHVVRRLNRDGTLKIFAGTRAGFDGDGGPAINARMSLPMAVAVGPDGVYISDAGNSRIRRVTADGVIRTIAGFGPAQDTYGGGFAGDGGPAEKAQLFSATALQCDSAGSLYIADSGNNRIRVIRDGIISTIAGTGRNSFGGDGGAATAADLNAPQKLVIAADGSIFLSDRASQRVRKIDRRGIITTVAGGGNPAGMLFDARSDQ